VTISVGVACLPDDAATKDELVDAADRALYDAKPSSRLRGDPAARDPYLAALDETALALRERLQPEVVLETIMARATALLGTPHGYIYLADETEGALVVRVGVGLFARFVGDRMAFGTGLGGQVYATGQPVVVDDYDGFENRLPDMPPGLLGAIPRAGELFRIFVHPATTLPFDRLTRVSATDLRLLRRIIRDRHHRGYSAADNILRWPSVQAGEREHIFPYQDEADAVFDTALIYEPAVLKVFAERYLLEVPQSHPAYATAHRLRYLVDRFVSIYPDHVPPTSIIREFIGGSGFEY
jgi:hypothetical protein